MIYHLLLHINRNINQGSSLTFSNTSFAHNLFFSQFNFKSKESFSIHNHLGFSVSANCYSFLRTNFDSTNTIFDYVRVYHIINVWGVLNDVLTWACDLFKSYHQGGGDWDRITYLCDLIYVSQSCDNRVCELFDIYSENLSVDPKMISYTFVHIPLSIYGVVWLIIYCFDYYFHMLDNTTQSIQK